MSVTQGKTMKNSKTIILASAIIIINNNLVASDGVAHFINFYELISENVFAGLVDTSVLAALFSLMLLIFIGKKFTAYAGRIDETPCPESNVSLGGFVDVIMDFVYGLTKENCGKNYRRFLPLMAGLFFYILVSNLSGLIPGFPPTTENFNTNLSMGFVAFLCYNYAGIKEHGASYIHQFTGPFLVLAPLFLCIELISHSVRPLSLAFRLLANIFCDHLLLGVFSGLVPLVVPSLFLLFGLLVAVVQSFVFTLLTGIYVNMAISHDH